MSRQLAAFPSEGAGIERYAAVFDCVEINSSFYRPHQRKTYERWATATPPGFRFSVKAPRTITHEHRLVGAEDLIARFLDETSGLGDRRGPLLVQLPPSLRFDIKAARGFLAAWRARTDGATAIEPRHASWFSVEADALLARFAVARVAADPAVIPEAARTGGASALRYRRWHGSPAIYESAYDNAALDRLAGQISAEPDAVQSWCILDNTKFGAATTDALALRERLLAGTRADQAR